MPRCCCAKQRVGRNCVWVMRNSVVAPDLGYLRNCVPSGRSIFAKSLRHA
nr:MAG TPA: hypothetical protein [Caudoviricetes sp.]